MVSRALQSGDCAVDRGEVELRQRVFRPRRRDAEEPTFVDIAHGMTTILNDHGLARVPAHVRQRIRQDTSLHRQKIRGVRHEQSFRKRARSDYPTIVYRAITLPSDRKTSDRLSEGGEDGAQIRNTDTLKRTNRADLGMSSTTLQ